MCQWFESTSERAFGPPRASLLKEEMKVNERGFFPKSGGSRLPVPKAGWASSVRVFIDRVDPYVPGGRRGVAQSGQRICFGYRGP